MTCKAYQDSSGQMVCVPCGLQWDADDPDPPKCWRTHNLNNPALTKRSYIEIHKNVGRKHLTNILKDLKK